MERVLVRLPGEPEELASWIMSMASMMIDETSTFSTGEEAELDLGAAVLGCRLSARVRHCQSSAVSTSKPEQNLPPERGAPAADRA